MNRTNDSTGSVRRVSRASSERVPGAIGRLGLAHELGRGEVLTRVRGAGYADVTTAMIALFRFAGMDGRRPGAIAATARLSKQATNDMLRELERLDYVERHPDPTDGRARIIRLTKRGKGLDAAAWEAGREVEHSWKTRFDDEEWRAFNTVLDNLIRSRLGVG